MAQSNGITQLKRIELEYKNSSYEFSVNPQELSVTYKNRAQVTQTLGGFWVDKFGEGLTEISISGITGFKLQKEADEGFKKYQDLKKIVQESFGKEVNLRTLDKIEPMTFYNLTDEEYYAVIPSEFTLQRSVSSPLVYRYSLKLYVIEDYQASKPNKSLLNTGGMLDGTIGKDLAETKTVYLDSLKSEWNTFKESNKIAKFIKEKVPFSSQIGKAIDILGVDIDLSSGTVKLDGGLSLGGMAVPFSFDNKNGSSVGVSVKDTGTLLDGLNLMTGTDGKGQLAPLSFNYSMAGIAASCSTKLFNPQNPSENIETSTNFDYNSKLSSIEELYQDIQKGNYQSFNYESYINAPKTADSFSSILSINYGKADSLLQWRIEEIDKSLTTQEKNAFLNVLLNSIIITADIQNAMLGSPMKTTKSLVLSQIENLNTLLEFCRAQTNTDFYKLITLLETLRYTYCSLVKIQLFGGEVNE